MKQLHRRLIGEKVLLRGYCQGMLDRATVEEVLEIGRSRFFALLKEYRHDPDRFSRLSKREPDYRVPVRVEKEVERKLMLDKSLTMKSQNDGAPATDTAYLQSDADSQFRWAPWDRGRPL